MAAISSDVDTIFIAAPGFSQFIVRPKTASGSRSPPRSSWSSTMAGGRWNFSVCVLLHSMAGMPVFSHFFSLDTPAHAKSHPPKRVDNVPELLKLYLKKSENKMVSLVIISIGHSVFRSFACPNGAYSSFAAAPSWPWQKKDFEMSQATLFRNDHFVPLRGGRGQGAGTGARRRRSWSRSPVVHNVINTMTKTKKRRTADRSRKLCSETSHVRDTSWTRPQSCQFVDPNQTCQLGLAVPRLSTPPPSTKIF